MFFRQRSYAHTITLYRLESKYSGNEREHKYDDSTVERQFSGEIIDPSPCPEYHGYDNLKQRYDSYSVHVCRVFHDAILLRMSLLQFDFEVTVHTIAIHLHIYHPK